MNKSPVHSVTPVGFIWSFTMLKNRMKSTQRSSREQRAPFLCLCGGSWVYMMENQLTEWWYQPRNGMSYFCSRDAHSWATQPPVGVSPQPPESLSFPDWVSARYQEQWGWQTAKSLFLTHCTDPIKGFDFFFSELHILTSLPILTLIQHITLLIL